MSTGHTLKKTLNSRGGGSNYSEKKKQHTAPGFSGTEEYPLGVYRFAFSPNGIRRLIEFALETNMITM